MRKKGKYSILLLFIIITMLNSSSIKNRGWWKLYFTTIGFMKGNVERIENPEKGLIRLINSAQKSFYGAFYDISSQIIAEALLMAYNRGVDVKLVVERDNFHKKAIRMIRKAGIYVVTDNRSGLMHNKFAIVDRRITWTGSYNLTSNGAYRNNNNAIEIHSSDLTKIYHDEFFEMFKYNIFGNKKEYRVFSGLGKKYYVKMGDISINAYFSPDDNIERIISKRIKKAKKSIHFMVFSFTSDKLGEEIICAFKKGVKVYGIVEKQGAKSKYSEYIKMKIEGIPVKLDKNRYIMHHKVIIVDEDIVITGSYNFSMSAHRRNDENILIIESPEISREYLYEFYRLYN